jgi:hypothetical protein
MTNAFICIGLRRYYRFWAAHFCDEDWLHLFFGRQVCVLVVNILANL